MSGEGSQWRKGWGEREGKKGLLGITLWEKKRNSKEGGGEEKKKGSEEKKGG